MNPILFCNKIHGMKEFSHPMRTQFSKIVLSAALGLAMIFTFSCSSGDDGSFEYGSVKDSKGKAYKTIKIGNQT